MNRPIARLFIVVLVMFGAARRLHLALDGVRRERAAQNQQAQRADAAREEQSPRGPIYAAVGRTPARVFAADELGTYVRRYPFGALFASADRFLRHRATARAAGLEAYRSAALTGTPPQHESIVAQLEGHQTGRRRRRHHVEPGGAAGRDARSRRTHPTAPSSRWCRAAVRSRVFASDPSYNPNAVVANTSVRRPRNSTSVARGRAGRSTARVDVQGRDGDRGDRQRPAHAELRRQRQLADHDLPGIPLSNDAARATGRSR